MKPNKVGTNQKMLAVMTCAVMAFALAGCTSATAAGPSGSAPITAGASPTSHPSPTAGGPSATPPAAAEASPTEGTPISILIGDRTISAVLNNSAAARDFLATLPVTLPATQVGGIEYMMELPAPLTETGPFYRTVEAGDIVYWNPRNSVTIIYEPTSPVSELTKLGEVTSDLSAFRGLPSNVDIRIEAR